MLVALDTKGKWLEAFFMNENLNRFSNPADGHAGSCRHHLAVLIVLFAPWSTFLIATFWYAVREAAPPIGQFHRRVQRRLARQVPVPAGLVPRVPDHLLDRRDQAAELHPAAVPGPRDPDRAVPRPLAARADSTVPQLDADRDVARGTARRSLRRRWASVRQRA